ncbi:MAG: ammonia-forming cytochrome c nitrite reductase subunit c552 [Gemmatimonadota bacterium]
MPSGTHTTLLLLVLAGVVGFTGTLGLATVQYGEGTAYLSDDPTACIQCHIMRDQFDDPWLRAMWSGYAFSIDYRESRGHAFSLHDQDHTQRILQREQPGACLHCHASVGPLYRYLGDGDAMAGFVEASGMAWDEARFMTDDDGRPLVEHPLSCVDCHTPGTMELRVTRPAFMVGIRALKASQGVEDYDVNQDATRQEMRTFVCGQCHVEYYFDPDNNKAVTYPWSDGLRAHEIEAYYENIGFDDWTHGTTGGGMLKAQHPEFELWNQGVHAAAGVSCADDLIDRASDALVDLITVLAAARDLGATDADLAEALDMQRRAQWRLDFIYSEGSRGFHASQETAKVLAESVDYARQGERLVAERYGARLDRTNVDIMPVEGVTPDSLAPGRTGPTVPGTSNRR